MVTLEPSESLGTTNSIDSLWLLSAHGMSISYVWSSQMQHGA